MNMKTVEIHVIIKNFLIPFCAVVNQAEVSFVLPILSNSWLNLWTHL